MENEFLIPISFFGMIITIVYLALRQKERMALINKGLDPNAFNQHCESALQLKVGLLLIGIASGILAGNILSIYSKLEPWASHLSMIFIFTGSALILSYFLLKKFPPHSKHGNPS